MIWRSRKTSPDQAPYQSRGSILAAQLLTAAEVDFDAATKLQQALIGTFLFGMLTAEGMNAGRSPSEIRAGAIGTFQDALHYTLEAAVEGVEHCIQATAPGAHETMKAIIHRGIDGHRQILDGDKAGLAQNIGDVLRRFESQS